jgi:aryl-alcohol dehydrogenase-like predicted oxidoreductase
MKLCLGTAQFGQNYGINNKRGKVPQEEILNILKHSLINKIVMLDTASAYGESEAVLGKVLQSFSEKFAVITKYPADSSIRPITLIDISLRLLQTNNIYGYLFHSFSTFKDYPNLLDDFVEIKRTGKTKKIGFSLYYPAEAEFIIENNIPCDIVQVPYNIFDQRFSGIFSTLKSLNIEIHVRSVFLQGLFFIPHEKLLDQFSLIKDKIAMIQMFSKENNINIAETCFGFVNTNTYIDKIIFGVDSLENLTDNIKYYNNSCKSKLDFSFFKTFEEKNENIILPFNWQNS